MAEHGEIISALEDLALHSKIPVLNPTEYSRWLTTWCEDLSQFSIVSIRAACRNWRQGDGATKFPTPGQLLPLVRACEPRPARQDTGPKAWTWPTDEELQTMTLEEKVRQFRIMAHATRSKAGPMGDDGKVPRPEFVEQAENYWKEAHRLSELLAKYRREGRAAA